jgi:hypothetical protein
MYRSSPFTRPVALVAFVGLVVVAGCGDSSPAATSEQTALRPVAEAPSIVSFSADPETVVDGEEATLSWELSDPTATVRIAPLGGEISGTSAVVSPVISTTYRLTATNTAGSTSASVVVGVVPEGTTVGGSRPTGTDVGTPLAAAGDWVPAATNLVGQPTECGNLTFVTSHPDRDMIIAGVALNGLWASIDGSEEWAQLGQFGGDEIRNRTTNIIFDPGDPDTFWQSGIYSGPGVFRTTNGAATFEALGDVAHSDLLSIDLGDPQRKTMLSATHEQTVVWRSRDAGETWEDISGGLPDDIGYTTSVHVVDPVTYLVGTNKGGDGAGVFYTEDGGFTWERVFDVGVIGRPLAASDGMLYWLLEGGLGVTASADDGRTWDFVTGDGPHADPAMSIIELPDGRIAATAGKSVVVSADKGASWETVGPPAPFDLSGIAYSETRNAFYAWHSDCSDEIVDDSIARLDLDEQP